MAKAKKVTKLLFVDTNIWLDFYRGRGEATHKILEHLEKVKEQILTTHVLEMEFRKNRWRAVTEGLKNLASIEPKAMLGIFSNAKASKTIQKNIAVANKRLDVLRNRLLRALKDPVHQDPVCVTFQRILAANGDLNLGFDDKRGRAVRRLAALRFNLGYPPRKDGDISIGDAYNWEWMIECANKKKAEIVLLTRDSDFGNTVNKSHFLNGFLKQEFSERVSRKRNVHLCRFTFEALKHFGIQVSQKEELEEKRVIVRSPAGQLDLGEVIAGDIASQNNPAFLSQIVSDSWLDSAQIDVLARQAMTNAIQGLAFNKSFAVGALRDATSAKAAAAIAAASASAAAPVDWLGEPHSAAAAAAAPARKPKP